MEEDERELIAQVLRSANIFFGGRRRVLSRFKHYDLGGVSALVTMLRVSTSDAILVQTALEAGCRYFVTEDRFLRKLLRRLSKMKGIAAQGILLKMREKDRVRSGT